MLCDLCGDDVDIDDLHYQNGKDVCSNCLVSDGTWDNDESDFAYDLSIFEDV